MRVLSLYMRVNILRTCAGAVATCGQRGGTEGGSRNPYSKGTAACQDDEKAEQGRGHIAPTAISLGVCLAAVPLQPGLELGRFILQYDPVQETTPQGQANGENAQAERLPPGVRLQLLLFHT
jgi:hypothetical protein